jgi:DNA repair exonuclease SbcCD ATPase subunit
LGPKGDYEVTREIDREGSYYAQLADLASGKVLAKGVGKVQKRLDALLDLSFEEFRYSFYLGQKELDVLRAVEGLGKRRALDQMIGISDVDLAIERVGRDVSALSTDLERLKLEHAHTRTRLSEYEDVEEGEGPVSARLREIDEKIDRLRSQEKDIARQREECRARHDLRSRTIAGLEALRVKIYAEALGRLRDRVSAASASLARSLESAYKELTHVKTQHEQRRDLSDRLEELERLVIARREELEDQVRNTLEGAYSDSEIEFLTPESKAEQLFVTRRCGRRPASISVRGWCSPPSLWRRPSSRWRAAGRSPRAMRRSS